MQRDKSSLLFVAFMAILSPVHGDDARDQHRAMLANKRTEANRTEVGRLNSSRDETKNSVGDATPDQLKYMSASERAEYNKLLARREQTKDRISDMTRKSARPSAIGGARRTLKNTQDEIDRLVAKAAERMSRYVSNAAMQEREKMEAELAIAENLRIQMQNQMQQEQDRKIAEARQTDELVSNFKAVNSTLGEQIQGISVSIKKHHIQGISKPLGVLGGMEYFEIQPDRLGVEIPPALKRFNAQMFICFNAYDGELLGVEYRTDSSHMAEIQCLLKAKYELEWDGLVARRVNVGNIVIYVDTISLLGGSVVLRYTDVKRVERARLNDAVGL